MFSSTAKTIVFNLVIMLNTGLSRLSRSVLSILVQIGRIQSTGWAASLRTLVQGLLPSQFSFLNICHGSHSADVAGSSLQREEQKNPENYVFFICSIFTWYWLGMIHTRTKAIAYSHTFTEWLYKQFSNLCHAVILVALLTRRSSPRNWVVSARLASQIHCSHCHQHRALPFVMV